MWGRSRWGRLRPTASGCHTRAVPSGQPHIHTASIKRASHQGSPLPTPVRQRLVLHLLGDVAELIGQGGPRQVGAVLSRYGSSVTWWRVIRASGDVPEDLADEALAHWREEGTAGARRA